MGRQNCESLSATIILTPLEVVYIDILAEDCSFTGHKAMAGEEEED